MGLDSDAAQAPIALDNSTWWAKSSPLPDLGGGCAEQGG
jgi:hypothetical protein